MGDLYGRFKVRYELSRNSLSKIKEDDAYLDMAAFDAQQALEFLMKYILDEHGVEYRKTHNIVYLNNLVHDVLEYDRYADAVAYGQTITAWEEESRYGKGAVTTENLIRECYGIIDSLNESWLKNQEKSPAKESSGIGSLFHKAEGT